MAKSKKSKKAPARKRISGVGSTSKISTAVYIIGGAVGAYALAKFLPPTMNEKIKAAIPVVAGVLLVPRFVRGATGMALSAGMIGAGGLKLIQSFGVLDGMGETPMIAMDMYNNSRRMLSGVNDESVPMVAGISGLSNIKTLAALEES